ncbi:MAG: hypothetical protein ACRESR_10715 [Gammaproteobacteria bacterium]
MKPTQARRLLAQEAARILSEEGRRDHLAAKRKAAARLGLAERHLPTNREVEAALAERQRLFEAPAQAPRLERLRRGALAAMDALADFETRAAGAAAGEVATAHARIEMHVFTDSPEALAFRLTDLGLPWRESARRLRWCDGRERQVPVFAFSVGEETVEALAFTLTELREAPADPANGRPMRRLNRRALEQALAQRQPRSPA